MFEAAFEKLKFQRSLGSDNHSGVHPQVLEALGAANRGHAHAYGLDELSALAELEFKRVFGERVECHYVFTGTAANVLAFAPYLRSFEGIFCSDMAHIHRDECAAPEKFLSAKLYALPSPDGRIRPEQCAPFLSRMGDQHFAQPRAVSLTQPTEVGVSYRLEEIKAWRRFSNERNLMLHLDGARLSNAAAFLGVSLKNLTHDLGVDVVSFGGTKNGLMGAEALLFFTPKAKDRFKFYRKQAMQLSSKTRFMAAQFYAYLKDDLWLDIARSVTSEAQALAERLKAFPELEVPYPVESNAVFVRLPKAWVQPLRESFFFYIWDPDISLARWMISFDWRSKDSDDLIAKLKEVQRCHPRA